MIAQGIIVFVKNPELGKVKTRIAQSVGDKEALRIYKELLAFTRTLALSVQAKRYVFYARTINESDQWTVESFDKRMQTNGDLGDKMSTAIAECLTEVEKVLIIGSDCASLTKTHIEQAYAQLDESDVVLGPTFDGGYYLIGMKKHHNVLFENIEWSTPSVFTRTIEKIKEHNLTYTKLEQLSDIDYIDDWERYGW